MNRLILLVLAATTIPFHATARSLDRQQPMNIEADHALAALVENDPTTLTGNVIITQGSMKVVADKGVIYPRNGDIGRAVFEGAPVRLNQLMDDGTPMDAVAQGVDYDLETETVIFTGSVVINRPGDVLQGERVVYDLDTGKMEVNGPEGSRVKMRIAPKRKAPAAGASK